MYVVKLNAGFEDSTWVDCPNTGSSFPNLNKALVYLHEQINQYIKYKDWVWRLYKDEILLGEWKSGQHYDALIVKEPDPYLYNKKPTLEI